ncbi:MAG: BMP family ABC transporter substrate-binding protein [Ruminiclostridium sp.]|nr:BMP family ABC transporter substrate-binding protein [Ruminiclostridium sp.]
MNNSQILQRALIIAAAVVVLAIVGVLAFVGLDTKTTFRVGLVLTGTTTDSGWNETHYNGVVSACEKLDTKLIVKENIAEGTGDCEKAIHDLAKEGVHMIILSSYSYPDEVKDVIESYPNIAFYGISSYYSSENMTSYFGRMYQARYLAGVIAGMKTKTDSIGYVAAMPNNEVNRGINAFTLGVKSVNPDAKVYVSWTNSWDDEATEISCAEKLIKDKNVDVMSYHQNRHAVAATADKAGIYSIGYNKVAEGMSENYLTAAVWNWESLYYQIIREYVQGKPNTVKHRWFGLDSSAVELAPFSPSVDEETVKAYESARNEVLSGDNIFAGEIYDNNGEKRCGDGEKISDETLLTAMDWYVDGVIIYEA